MFLFSFLKKAPSGRPGPMLHNTLSGKLERFVPLAAREVKMYNCGPTVYDRQHIGNMFAAVLPDTLRRVLEASGYRVKQVINITDFGHLTGDNEGDPDIGEDKMSKGLKREGLTPSLKNMRTLAEKYAELYIEDLGLLGVQTKKISFPRASDYIPEQIALIKTLEQKGYAYTTSDGVYYDTAKFKGYGKLGNIDTSTLEAGARVEINQEKHSPSDFALWKSQAEGKGTQEKLGWESPWGLGFPGWHIECTAMIFKLLGRQIDIHTGGIEHIPIHHNNEIAQAEAVSGKQYVRYWLHNEHITVEGKKISKSLGNTVYLHNIVDKGYSARAFRYWVLSGHYRTPMNFTWDAIEGADTALKRLVRLYLSLPDGGSVSTVFKNDFYSTISNDLDTAGALAKLWELAKSEGAYSDISPADKKVSLAYADKLLGLGFSTPQEAARLKVVEQNKLPEDIQTLLEERETARKAKDFAKSDELRTEIESRGFVLKDTASGVEVTKQ